MKLPRDLSGREFAKLLGKFGYQVDRQRGSHIRLSSRYKNYAHRITIPDHPELKVGTLQKLIRLVAQYLELETADVIRELFNPEHGS